MAFCICCVRATRSLLELGKKRILFACSVTCDRKLSRGVSKRSSLRDAFILNLFGNYFCDSVKGKKGFGSSVRDKSQGSRVSPFGRPKSTITLANFGVVHRDHKWNRFDL